MNILNRCNENDSSECELDIAFSSMHMLHPYVLLYLLMCVCSHFFYASFKVK